MRLLDPARAFALAAGLLASSTLAARAETFIINSWPQDIGKVPCAAWNKGPDGSWKQVATIQAGSLVINGKSFPGASGEGKMLAAKCHQ